MNKSIKCKRTLDMLKLWTALKDERDAGSDDVRDLITYKDDLYTGYFIMVNKNYKVLYEFTDDAYKTFNKEYIVFAQKDEFLKSHKVIPEDIGIICTGNLYGLGGVTKIMREAKLKKQ